MKLSLVLAATLPLAFAQTTPIPAGDWPRYTRDLANTKFSPLTQINTTNISKLAPAWTYRLRTDAELLHDLPPLGRSRRIQVAQRPGCSATKRGAIVAKMTDATIPADMRWIPKGMAVEYLRKAVGTMHGVATPEPAAPVSGDGHEWPVKVEVVDDAGEAVFRARVLMWVSPRKHT